MRSLPWLLVVASCTPITPFQPPPPQGLRCDRIVIPPGALEASLASASAGDCVILPSGTYSGSFVLPENVTLAASDGAMVTLTGGNPVLTVKGGSRSIVRGLRIVGGSGSGIAIEPGPVQLISVAVTQSQQSAITATCSRPDCAEREIAMTDCEVTQSAVGLRIVGARVSVEGGRIAEQLGTSLSSGSGVVASDGAAVTLRNVTIERNQNIGVLLDGAATRATVDGCTIRENTGRGLWAQGQTADAGVETVTVTGGEISGNSLIGIGARDTSGLVIRQTRILTTKAIRVPIDISTSEDIGDGIGLFTGTRAVTIEGVVAENNARAQVLADGSGLGVTVSGTVSGGRFRVVVQRPVAPVMVEQALVDAPATELLVRAAAIGLAP
ncbi:MAG: right-handed parallel beta-helix repeat-containing protein [Myxococcales bacterium]|nr:right-handed parallel beta-helix repeat-containing protein [Myxococcales bacterium]MDP3503672.1 right-handed parallel beta-helix repeat-containing protein [Myxococcales bacterium]